MTNDLQIFLISDQQDSKDVFANLGEGIVCQSDWRDSLQQMIGEVPKETQVLIVEIASDSELSLIQSWIDQNKETPVYIITDSSDPGNVKNMMKSGVRDVFLKPLKVDEVSKEMKQVRKEQEDKKPGGKLVSFIDVKGGNGCTTMVVNTALDIAKTGKMKVLLVDLDIQFGDAAAIMDMRSSSTVLEALSQAERLDSSLLTTLVSEAEHGLSVLASPDKVAYLDVVRVKDVQQLMEAALKAYDLVLFDLPRVVTPWSDEILRWSDHVFLVAQGSVSDVRGGSLLEDHLRTIGVKQESIYFLHNRAGAKNTYASVDSDQLAKSLKTDQLITVRSDYPTAIQSSDLGKAASDYAPNSKLARDIRGVAKLILELCGHHVEEKNENMFVKFFKKHGET